MRSNWARVPQRTQVRGCAGAARWRNSSCRTREQAHEQRQQTQRPQIRVNAASYRVRPGRAALSAPRSRPQAARGSTGSAPPRPPDPAHVHISSASAARPTKPFLRGRQVRQHHATQGPRAVALKSQQMNRQRVPRHRTLKVDPDCSPSCMARSRESSTAPLPDCTLGQRVSRIHMYWTRLPWRCFGAAGSAKPAAPSGSQAEQLHRLDPDRHISVDKGIGAHVVQVGRDVRTALHRCRRGGPRPVHALPDPTRPPRTITKAGRRCRGDIHATIVALQRQPAKASSSMHRMGQQVAGGVADHSMPC